MGTIISSIESIDGIFWTQLRKGRVTAAKRVLALDETSVIIELANGEFTVAGRRHTPNGKWAVLSYGLDHFGKSVLDGLAHLGIITKDDVKAHVKRIKANDEGRKLKHAERDLIRACEQLGIPVPAYKKG